MLQRVRAYSALLVPILLAGCVGDRERPAPAPVRKPPSVIGRNITPPPTPRETQQCHADLTAAEVKFTPLPDKDYGGGCALAGTVQLLDVGVPIGGIKGMRCELASGFIGWLRFGVAPASFQLLGSELVRVETFGTYACRNVVGNMAGTGKLSGHAIANAVDVSGFVLADGRRITVRDSWHSSDPQVREFWQTIRRSACRRFGTVLSPEYNAAHHDHLHLEMDKANFCR